MVNYLVHLNDRDFKCIFDKEKMKFVLIDRFDESDKEFFKSWKSGTGGKELNSRNLYFTPINDEKNDFVHTKNCMPKIVVINEKYAIEILFDSYKYLGDESKMNQLEEITITKAEYSALLEKCKELGVLKEALEKLVITNVLNKN